MTEHLRVTARLDSIAIVPGGPFGLDAPLSWAWVERARAQGDPKLPPVRDDFVADFPLPLARWGDDPWIWRTSRAHWDVAQHVTVNVRRKPATLAMSRYSAVSKHHSGLGPYKARDTVLPGVVAPTVWWDVEATDRDTLADLLSWVTHLGPRHRNGHGHIVEWRIDAGPTDGWRDRPMPDPHGPVVEGVRAPYWHATRRHPVTHHDQQ